MRIKDLFTVPQGTKVTEKAFGRVLISSICSILLCMACLAGTSWAWFTTSIDADKIEIDIAPVTLETQVKLGSEILTPQENGSYMLVQGEYKLQVALKREEPKSTAYVLVSIQHEDTKAYHFFTFKGNETPEATLTVTRGTADINFKVTWISPDGAEEIQDKGVITVGQLPDTTTSETTETTEATETTETTETAETTETVETTETAETTDSSQSQLEEESNSADISTVTG